MPGFLLHKEAPVRCLHQGQAKPTVTNSRVRVAGKETVLQPFPYAVTGCPFNAGGAPSPCATAQWLKPTAALRVTSNQMPVLLTSSQAICVPNGTGLTIFPAQIRVRGM